jgi:hypothetical protein
MSDPERELFEFNQPKSAGRFLGSSVGGAGKAGVAEGRPL